MAIDWVKDVEKRYMKSSLPVIHPGDTVKVKIRIVEGNKERTQAYEGVVIKMRGSGINKTLTVRRVFQGVGVERVFLLHSPKVESIQILRKGDVRRSKLYYLRELTGKAARIKERLGAAAEKAKLETVAIDVAVEEAPAAVAEEVVAEAAPVAAEAVVETAVEAPATEAVVAEAAAPVAEAAPEAAAPAEEKPAPAEEA